MKRFILPFLLLCLLLSGCSEKSAQQTVFAMNTVMELQVWGADSEAAVAELQSTLYTLESQWSATREDSILSAINRGQSIPTDPEQTQLLQAVEQLSWRTEGAFDPGLYAVSRLWDFTGEAPHVPPEDQLKHALTREQWDLGGALKGYAGQKCAQLLAGMDVQRAILNLGGNIQTFGEKPNGSPWQVGIQNPDGGDYLGILSVSGTASIVTSGDYQRYFEENGVRYHHILDPETGYPASSGLRSVTVICRDGLTADALSTALFVMGLERGISFWQESNDFEAVFITVDGKIHATEGALLSGCQYEVISR